MSQKVVIFFLMKLSNYLRSEQQIYVIRFFSAVTLFTFFYFLLFFSLIPSFILLLLYLFTFLLSSFPFPFSLITPFLFSSSSKSFQFQILIGLYLPFFCSSIIYHIIPCFSIRILQKYKVIFLVK